MERKYVYKAIESEREYQEIQKKKETSHVVEDFPLAAGMEAIRYNIEKANQAWYSEKSPYPTAMEYVRKIAAICVQMGEKYEMPSRDLANIYPSSESPVYECVAGKIICPGCFKQRGTKFYGCAGCGGTGYRTCGKCNGIGCK